ncbi:hypothetical protein M3Y94_01149000 [Aphelenchoides besseyi]|nr:hypothetical protein M3Y94_01149000 [Aphelenchoides besseyi]
MNEHFWRLQSPFITIFLWCHISADYPWTFDDDLFGGPSFWGLISTHWKLCTIGQLQSPVNVDPGRLLFDPSLGPIQFSRNHVEAQFQNTGQLPVVMFNETEAAVRLLNITNGPASPYTYRLHHVAFHFGRVRENERGSEHTIDRVRFPAELQLMAYNSDLYDNFTEAMSQPRGLLAIAVIVDIGDKPNAELRRMTVASQSITYKDSVTKLHKFKPFDLLPDTSLYVTYEGSLTHPGCQETVTWIIMNQPVYITREDLSIWDQMQQTEKQSTPVYMSPNYRPLKPLNGRLFRTNIKADIKSRSPSGHCPSNIYVDLGYRSNPKRTLAYNSTLSGFDSLRHRRETTNDEFETIGTSTFWRNPLIVDDDTE